VDFRQIASAALASLDSLVLQWLPEGRREGHEWKSLNPTRADSAVGSFSINLRTGCWADFATGDKGGDPVSLYAYLQGIGQGEAAKRLAEQLRVDLVEWRPAPAATPRTDWTPVVPVPDDAGEAPAAHVKRGRPVAQWAYRDREGRLLGHVYRFTVAAALLAYLLGLLLLAAFAVEERGISAVESIWLVALISLTAYLIHVTARRWRRLSHFRRSM
jgi:hypothetical protein